MRTRPAVAVIGAGFSGLLTAIHLMRQSDECSPRIYLIDNNHGFGAGKAYSTGNISHRLNTRAANMSAFADAPDHFLQWAARNAEFASVDGGSFVSRRTYGEYLNHLMKEAAACEGAAGRLYVVPDEAVSLAKAAGGYEVQLAVGKTLHVDAVAVATGNPPPHPPQIGDAAYFKTAGYVSDPWSPGWIGACDPGEAVLLLGTGLTMVDVLLSLKDSAHRGAIYALSRRGLLPRPHVAKTAAGFTPPALPSGLAGALQLVRRCVRTGAPQGVDWRDVIDALRPGTRGYWRSLDLAAQRRFLRHLRPWWDVHRHRLAPDVAARIEQMRAGGFFTVLRGRLTRITAGSIDAEAAWRPAGGGGVETLRIHRMVNCMGPGGDPARSHSPLLLSLLTTGLARPDALNLGFDSDASGALIDRGGAVSRSLFAVGPPLRGSLWEITAVPDIRVQAQETAASILRHVMRTSA